MNMEIEKEKMGAYKIVKEQNQVTTIEGDCIVPDSKPDIIESITTSGTVCIYKKEVLDGKIRIDGCINTYLMYRADATEDGVRGLNTGLDFTEIIEVEDCRQGMELDIGIQLQNIDCKILNGRKVSLKAQVEFQVKVFSVETTEILKSIQNQEEIQKLNKCLKVNSLMGSATNKAYAKDTISIDNTDNFVEVLKSEIKIVNKDFKVSYNKILAKADMSVKIVYLTEDNRIAKTEGIIPVMGFVDMNGVTEDAICDMKYLLKNLVIKPNEVQEHSIYVEAEVEFTCHVYETKEVNIIQDLYSPTCDMKFAQKEIATITDKKETKDICRIRETIAVPEVEGNTVKDITVNPIITNKSTTTDRLQLEGELKVEILYGEENIDVVRKEFTLPIHFEMNIPGINQNTKIQVAQEIREPNFVIMPGGSIESKVDIEFCVESCNPVSMNIIDKIEIEESREMAVYSMIIYFAKSGDTLWNIAKKFRSTVEDIVRVNEIEDENKIEVGQQLFIPRYVPQKKVTA